MQLDDKRGPLFSQFVEKDNHKNSDYFGLIRELLKRKGSAEDGIDVAIFASSQDLLSSTPLYNFTIMSYLYICKGDYQYLSLNKL